MSPPDAPRRPAPGLTLPHGDPVAVELTHVIHCGDLDGLHRLVSERPELASAHMIGRRGGGWRTPLHVAERLARLLPGRSRRRRAAPRRRADPDDDTGGDRPETPVHWAASTDDVDVAVAQGCHGGQRRAAERLLAAGADIDTSPRYAGNLKPVDQAVKPDTRCDLLATWLREQGATSGDAPNA